MKKVRLNYRHPEKWTSWEYALCGTVCLPKQFTLEDMTVELFNSFPERFRMYEYPFPDTHQVRCLLYGSRGMEARGLLLKDGGYWRVTDLGWSVRAELLSLANRAPNRVLPRKYAPYNRKRRELAHVG